MSPATLFALALPAARAVLGADDPRTGWRWTARVAGSPLIVPPVLAVYFATVVPILPVFAREMVDPDPAGVRARPGVAVTALGIVTVSR
jgi:hypothetical protein